jgi:hypothetical protein
MSDAAVLTLSREEMCNRALAFAKRWQGAQREVSNAKSFLDEFFGVFGRDRKAVSAEHEYPVGRSGRRAKSIDLLWPGKLLVEMKSTGHDLDEAARQAFGYIADLDADERPRRVLVCDFARFVLYDLGEDARSAPRGISADAQTFSLDELHANLHRFSFIRDEEQALFQVQPEVNQKAVALLGELHDALKRARYAGHDLARLLVRILFCLFAEDTDIFPWNAFTRFVEKSAKDGANLGERLAHLFQVLNTPIAARQAGDATDYLVFPYINGNLFAERLELAATTAAHRAALLDCCRFDWSKISPCIFGALFQGVMASRERREKGAHYTSEKNILRVINPLFLDDLRAEFGKIRVGAARGKRLAEFHGKLARLRFLDPACGCGNFLVVAYRELRALELELLRETHGRQLALEFDVGDIARVNVDQFYGIELDEFPSLIAQTALWLTDHQVNMTFSKTFGKLYTRIPLKTSPTIVHGNALQKDWNEILPAQECAFVMGNPPFAGAKVMSPPQRADMRTVCGEIKNYGLLDYVTAWYVKTAEYLQRAQEGRRASPSLSSPRAAFVSTSSISQGEQPGVLWAHLASRGMKIHFAHRPFVWRNEASGNARVHCVIIGFGLGDASVKRLFETDAKGNITENAFAEDIGPSLAPSVKSTPASRSKPLCSSVPPMQIGNKPIDGGNYLFDSNQKAEFLKKEPEAAPYFHRWVGAEQFLHGEERWCLWLGDMSATQWESLPECKKRAEAVADFRRASKSPSTQKLAEFPTHFHVENFPDKPYLVIPGVSSEKRDYIPVGFLRPSVFASNLLYVVRNATLYHFGVLSSKMHMVWTMQVCGRLESRYRYSVGIVYNNFPWPEPDEKQKTAIKNAAQSILDLRVELGDGRLGFLPARTDGARATLGALYGTTITDSRLLKAHQELDRAVDRAYRAKPFADNRERVGFLFARHERLCREGTLAGF